MNMIAKAPYQMEQILTQIQYFLQENLHHIESIRVVSRCCNCFKKTSDYTLTFNGNSLSIKDWCFKCNIDKEFEHTITIENFDYENLLIHVDKSNKDWGFALKMDYCMGSRSSFDLSAYYPPEDYKIHGEMAYEDRNIKLIERKVDNGLVIMLQNFIDFKGLMPKFSETIHIKFKEEY